MPLEKKLLVASAFPVAFQWSSSGFPVVFQCVPIMQINTGSPLGHHWALSSASVVPVASHCTCGYSGVPVWSVQWCPSVLSESGLEVNQVIRSGHFPACNPICIQLVLWESFELNWFHLTCNPKYTKTIMVLISKACTELCWSTHMCSEQNWYPLHSSKIQELNLQRPLHLLTGVPQSCHFKLAWMLLCLTTGVCVCVCVYIQSLQWCSSVGCKS